MVFKDITALRYKYLIIMCWPVYFVHCSLLHSVRVPKVWLLGCSKLNKCEGDYDYWVVGENDNECPQLACKLNTFDI